MKNITTKILQSKFTIILLSMVLLLPIIVQAGVCNVATGTCYVNVSDCSLSASNGDTCMITDGATYTQANILMGAENLTFDQNSTTGQPTVIGTSIGNPVFDFTTAIAIGNYTIRNLKISHADGMGIAVNNASTEQLTVENNDFNITATSGNNFGDGGATAAWLGEGSNHVFTNNTVQLEGGACCNYGIHVDGGVNNVGVTALITNNVLNVNGSGGFDGGIVLYSDILRQSTFTAQNNIINIIEADATNNAFSFGIYSENNFTTLNNFFDVDGIGDPMAGIWIETSSPSSKISIQLVGDEINVFSNAGRSAPIVLTELSDATIINVTMNNENGGLDIQTNNMKSTGNCFQPVHTDIINPIWTENITFTDSAWVNVGNSPCGDINVTYDVTIATGAPLANVFMNSTNPNAVNPTNFVTGTTDTNGNFTINIGGIFADNETAPVPPYISFMPYNLSVSGTGLITNSTTFSTTNGNFQIQLIVSQTPIPEEPKVPFFQTVFDVVVMGFFILILAGIAWFGIMDAVKGKKR